MYVSAPYWWKNCGWDARTILYVGLVGKNWLALANTCNRFCDHKALLSVLYNQTELCGIYFLLSSSSSIYYALWPSACCLKNVYWKSPGFESSSKLAFMRATIGDIHIINVFEFYSQVCAMKRLQEHWNFKRSHKDDLCWILFNINYILFLLVWQQFCSSFFFFFLDNI